MKIVNENFNKSYLIYLETDNGWDHDFQIFKEGFDPGERGQIRKHAHHSIHLCVVKGELDIRIGNDIHTIRENQHFYIPSDTIYFLFNSSQLSTNFIKIVIGGNFDKAYDTKIGASNTEESIKNLWDD
jgi:mannose-6-phosphate isomerase-like protein (cupin superfamily)